MGPLPTRLSCLFPVMDVVQFNEKKKNNIHNFNLSVKCNANVGQFTRIGALNCSSNTVHCDAREISIEHYIILNNGILKSNSFIFP